MPWAAPTVCRQAGCRVLVTTPGYCKEHRSQVNREYNLQRSGHNLQTDKWYHTARWQKLRASILAVEPLCRICVTEGRTTMANLVDHIKPVKFEGEFWDRGNLQPLCTKCHEIKSQAEGSRTPRYAMRKVPTLDAPLDAPLDAARTLDASTTTGGTHQGGALSSPHRLRS